MREWSDLIGQKVREFVTLEPANVREDIKGLSEECETREKMRKKASILWEVVATSMFEYETSKVVQIKSWKIGVVYRLIQLSIILYVSLWVMYHDKGYQVFDYPVAGVTAKLKGIAFANLSQVPSIGMRVWDTADFVIPPQQNSAFFVATNMVITPNQSLGSCPESPDVPGVSCVKDGDCVRGRPIHLGSGVLTGRCVSPVPRHPPRKGAKGVCEVYGWCPSEVDKMPVPGKPLLASAPNFTVLLKNSIEFPRFGVKRRNILGWMDKAFLHSCRYDPGHPRQRFCPIFRLQDIVDHSDAAHKDVWTHGGLVSIHIEWACDLDLDVELCVPRYTFRRLDDFKDDVGKGWNFRYSHHYVASTDGAQGGERRTLLKVYGIQFFITVSGRGGRFNPFKFSMNLGSGLALLGVASVLCDLFVLNIVRKRELYKKARVDSLKSIMTHRGGRCGDRIHGLCVGGNHHSNHVQVRKSCTPRTRKSPRDRPDEDSMFLEPPSSWTRAVLRRTQSLDCLVQGRGTFLLSEVHLLREKVHKVARSSDTSFIDER